MKIITRTSRLALKQVDEVMASFPDSPFSLIGLESFGDKHKDISLKAANAANFFTKELDEALLEAKGDIAVHSAKDLPYPLPAGLQVIALLGPQDQTDSLVSRGNITLSQLPTRSRVGTSSEGREQNILQLRSDINPVDIRGTIDERVALVDDGKVDAIIVATCALIRLGLEDRIAQRLPFPTHPLQGYLAVVAKSDRPDLIQQFAPIDVRKRWGRVTLVGAGPGAADLITLRGKYALDNADVVFYDDLLDETMLRDTRAKCIYVGKRKAHHSAEQAQINQQLADLAMSGKSVCRLKGGDPFIFGRGGEELAYLKQRLINVDVIPGITAALAAAAVSQIPLTERGVSSSVAFLTGHPTESICVPNADTLVYYMGASVLLALAQKVLSSGRSPLTPVALIHNASLPDQQIHKTTLQEIVAQSVTLQSPAIVIIGEVVDV